MELKHPLLIFTFMKRNLMIKSCLGNGVHYNTEGWANFLACLKAYLEYGINLRKGAFDFLSDKK